MKTYTFNEAIDEMSRSAGVILDGYGTWKCSATIGYREEKATDYFITHDEEWKIGEFNGEKYNEQDFDEWTEEFFEPEFNSVSNEALSLITDEMKEQMFKKWCNVLWQDGSNESNYEANDQRDRRIAERIFDSWKSESSPDNVFICCEKDKVIVLSEDELKFVNDKCDDGDHSYYEELCNGSTARFENDYAEN